MSWQQQWNQPPPPGGQAPYGYPPQGGPPPPSQNYYGGGPPYQQQYQQPPPPPMQQQPYGPDSYGNPPQQAQAYGGFGGAPQPQPAPYGQPQYPPQQAHAGQAYVDPQQIQRDAKLIWEACQTKRFSMANIAGSGASKDAKLINLLANQSAQQINEIRRVFPTVSHGRRLVEVLDKETAGNFKTTLKALSLGPLESETFWVNHSIKGMGTRESLLTEAVFGRSKTELQIMRQVYKDSYGESLERAVRGDLSLKTETLFDFGMEGRMDDYALPNDKVSNDARALYDALENRWTTDEITVCQIFAHSSASHMRNIAAAYKDANRSELRAIVKKKFTGHMVQVLLYILDGALSPIDRDAKLLEDSMKGIGTQDNLLISRLIRIHWDKRYLTEVKKAYMKLFGRDLVSRIRGDTSGDYMRLLVALVESDGAWHPGQISAGPGTGYGYLPQGPQQFPQQGPPPPQQQGPPPSHQQGYGGPPPAYGGGPGYGPPPPQQQQGYGGGAPGQGQNQSYYSQF